MLELARSLITTKDVVSARLKLVASWRQYPAHVSAQSEDILYGIIAEYMRWFSRRPNSGKRWNWLQENAPAEYHSAIKIHAPKNVFDVGYVSYHMNANLAAVLGMYQLLIETNRGLGNSDKIKELLESYPPWLWNMPIVLRMPDENALLERLNDILQAASKTD
ncbi:MAG: hypothetical protein HY552_05365 [Elusimicrobia bacterium]|nr:hypothetical protein [Elusimicrobiota bacterium]